MNWNRLLSGVVAALVAVVALSGAAPLRASAASPVVAFDVTSKDLSLGSSTAGDKAFTLTLKRADKAALVQGKNYADFYQVVTGDPCITTKMNPGPGISEQVTGIAPGTATIKFVLSMMDGSIVTGTCMVTVHQLVTSVSLPKTASIYLGASHAQPLSATVKPDNASSKALTWTSSDKTAVSVDSTGKITGLKLGKSATITATANDGSKKSAKCTVTVVATPVTSVALPASVTVDIGKKTTLKANVAPSDATNKAVAWKSSNGKVVTVDAGGVVTGIASGTATITATAKDGSKKSARCTVTVNNPQKLEISATVAAGSTLNLLGLLSPDTWSQKLTWASSDKNIVTVDPNGVATGMFPGTATVTATNTPNSVTGKETATFHITVTSAFVRTYGDSRFATAAAISKQGWNYSTTVYLVNGEDYADALAAIPLAALKNAPILLTDTDKTPDATVNEIKRLGAGNIVLLGGAGVISDAQAAALNKISYVTEVSRTAGKDRFITAAKLAQSVWNIC